MELGDKILPILTAKGLTQSDLANLLDTTRQNISSLLKKTNPHQYTLSRLAAVLGVTENSIDPRPTHEGGPSFAALLDYAKSEGYSVVEVASEFNVSPSMLYSAVRRDSTLTLIMALRFAALLPKMSLRWLFTGKGSPTLDRPRTSSVQRLIGSIIQSESIPGLNTRISILMRNLHMTHGDFSDFTNISPGHLFGLLSERATPSYRDISQLAHSVPQYSVEWLLTGLGERFEINPVLLAANSSDKGSIDIDDSTEKIVTKNGNTHHVVNDEFMMLEVPIIQQRAYAGYLRGWADPEYIETLPTINIMVEKVHRGIYRCFEAKGDSMTGSEAGKNQVFDGERIIGRQVGHHLWNSPLHIKDHPLWVIVHEGGILVKNISNHDVEGRTITLHSFNDDKQSYPDTEVSLNEVWELYRVVQKITPF